MQARTLILLAVAVVAALAATMLLWNIGCEGQLVGGGILAAGAGLFLAPHLPPWTVIPVMIAAGAAGGASRRIRGVRGSGRRFAPATTSYPRRRRPRPDRSEERFSRNAETVSRSRMPSSA